MFVIFFFCLFFYLDTSRRGPVQSAPCQGAAGGPELNTPQSDDSCWQVCPRGQRQHLVMPTGDHSQMAAAAQQPADPQGRKFTDVCVCIAHLSRCIHLQV